MASLESLSVTAEDLGRKKTVLKIVAKLREMSDKSLLVEDRRGYQQAIGEMIDFLEGI